MTCSVKPFAVDISLRTPMPLHPKVNQHLIKALMVHQVVCLGPVQHHDDTVSVTNNHAVDHNDVVPDVSVWDERTL